MYKCLKPGLHCFHQHEICSKQLDHRYPAPAVRLHLLQDCRRIHGQLLIASEGENIWVCLKPQLPQNLPGWSFSTWDLPFWSTPLPRFCTTCSLRLWPWGLSPTCRTLLLPLPLEPGRAEGWKGWNRFAEISYGSLVWCTPDKQMEPSLNIGWVG